MRSAFPFLRRLAMVIACTVAAGTLNADDATKAGAKPSSAAAKPAAAGTTKPATATNPTGVKTDAAHDAAMAEMAKYAMPGPQHEKLKAMEGTWKAVSKSWYAPGEPAVSEGVATNRLILGGRYLLQEYKGTMMGQPFEGWGITGYDNRRGTYTTFWVDNMSTATMAGQGSMDAAGKTMTLKGTGEGPDGKPTEYTMVTTVVDPNTHVFTMSAPVEGKDVKMVEITYTRQ